jgi:hypothetical protein
MRVLFAIAACGVASIASVVASLDGHADFVPFYVALAFCAASAAAAAANEPIVGIRRRGVQAAAGAWGVAAVWVGVLLVMANTVWQASSPPPTPEQSFLGVPATGYYLVGLYGGALLMLLAAGLPGARRRDRTAGLQAPERSDGALQDPT